MSRSLNIIENIRDVVRGLPDRIWVIEFSGDGDYLDGRQAARLLDQLDCGYWAEKLHEFKETRYHDDPDELEDQYWSRPNHWLTLESHTELVRCLNDLLPAIHLHSDENLSLQVMECKKIGRYYKVIEFYDYNKDGRRVITHHSAYAAHFKEP